MISTPTESGSATSTRKRRTLVDDARAGLDTPEGKLPDADLRDRIVRFELDQLCYQATLQRSADSARAGQGIGPETSMFKLYQTELNKRKADLRVRARGVNGLGWSGDAFATDDLKATRAWLMSKSDSIAGGTSEIQRNIIAKRVLGLPD
jgi:alkylation response protein AidB-like acyl-CoA dehydrogenase